MRITTKLCDRESATVSSTPKYLLSSSPVIDARNALNNMLMVEIDTTVSLGLGDVEVLLSVVNPGGYIEAVNPPAPLTTVMYSIDMSAAPLPALLIPFGGNAAILQGGIFDRIKLQIKISQGTLAVKNAWLIQEFKD